MTGQKQPNAAQVSRLLAQAGHDKAAPYDIWGRASEGFIVTRHAIRGDVAVLYSRASTKPDEAAPLIEAYAATLTAAGYNAQVRRNKAGLARSIDVLRWEA